MSPPAAASDGERVYAFRHATDGQSPGLYSARFGAGTVLASEPLDGKPDRWSRLPVDTLVTLSDTGVDAQEPLEIRCTA